MDIKKIVEQIKDIKSDKVRIVTYANSAQTKITNIVEFRISEMFTKSGSIRQYAKRALVIISNESNIEICEA
jgi:hypothetical protein